MLSRYLTTDIETSSPVGLVNRLYEGLLRQTHEARTQMVEGRTADRARSLSKALAIVGELQNSLDHEQGGEIARNLSDLYDFVTSRLVTANVDNQIAAIDEAVGVLEPLADAWRELAAGGGAGPGGAP